MFKYISKRCQEDGKFRAAVTYFMIQIISAIIIILFLLIGWNINSEELPAVEYMRKGMSNE